MASDTKEKKTAAKKKGSNANKKKTTAAANKTKSTTAKKTSTAKTASTKKSAAVKKETTKQETVKKEPANKTATNTKSAAKKTVAKKDTKKAKPVENKLNKTIVLTDEEVKEIRTEESKAIESLKIENSNREVKSQETEILTILGIEVPTGTSKEEKMARISYYAKDATIFSIIIPVIDLFAMLFIDAYKSYPLTDNVPVNYCLTLLIDFALIFIITFVIDYIHGELAVRRINNKK